MAAKRGKAQARRNGRSGGGEHGLPLWGWLVLAGVLVAVGVLVAPKLMPGKGGDGFFRPAPNPDAQPAAVADDEAVVDDDADGTAKKPEADKPKGQTQYDFYKLLPGNEVPMSDAEVAATARAEAARGAAPQPEPGDTGDADDVADAPAAPQPASATPRAEAATPAGNDAAANAKDAAAAPRANDTPYLLQAGAFGASGDAEALKAKIALLGLGARVESAQIGGRTVYRVRMGPYGSASELADAKRKLAAGGLPALAIRAK
ncbi:MAG TPA: SPOR domain-containing protein [Xanthomonadaceae bacterium]|nr:SPOR domain-containing protein [Xanthomonadaceae bacterium]